MSGILSCPVVAIVDEQLIFVGMAEEDASNDVWRESIHDLVEKVCKQ
jgi:hypothetical protein